MHESSPFKFYRSVMHYPATAFSINGQPTIVPIQSIGELVMGQRTHLSQKDIDRVRGMYNCDAWIFKNWLPINFPGEWLNRDFVLNLRLSHDELR